MEGETYEEKVERVAKAIWSALALREPANWELAGEFHKNRYRAAARAALEEEALV